VFRVKHLQDFLAGVMFILFGVAGLWLGRDYGMGSAARMGQGYFPFMLSAGLVLLGVIVAARGISVEGPAIEPGHWRPLFFVLLAVLIFGLLIERAGLVVTSVIVTSLAALGYRDTVRPLEIVALTVGLTFFCVILFIWLLGQQMPTWWWG
jgi:hypothetical protein